MRAALALLTICGATLGVGPTSRTAPLERLGWLAGCWESGSDGRTIVEEQWMRPRGGSMLGMSRTVRRDTTVAHELMRIVERKGEVVFIAQPSGQAPAEFVATEVREGSVVFANPRHDFPQRILYRRVGADSLVARVEGRRGNEVRGIDFRYVRARCP